MSLSVSSESPCVDSSGGTPNDAIACAGAGGADGAVGAGGALARAANLRCAIVCRSFSVRAGADEPPAATAAPADADEVEEEPKLKLLAKELRALAAVPVLEPVVSLWPEPGNCRSIIDIDI
jgi:hypothetical protein